MFEHEEIADSIFSKMSDYDISAFRTEKYDGRIQILKDEYALDASVTMTENVAQQLLYLCHRYAESNNL